MTGRGTPISGAMIYKAKALRAQGKTQAEIAVVLGVSQGTVSVILRRSGLGGHLTKVGRDKP